MKALLKYALIAVLRTRGFLNFGLEYVWDGANGLLAFIGLGDLNLLGDRYQPVELLYNNFAVLFGLVYVHLPFMVLPLYAALDRMDKSFLEASLDLAREVLLKEIGDVDLLHEGAHPHRRRSSAQP